MPINELGPSGPDEGTESPGSASRKLIQRLDLEAEALEVVTEAVVASVAVETYRQIRALRAASGEAQGCAIIGNCSDGPGCAIIGNCSSSNLMGVERE